MGPQNRKSWNHNKYYEKSDDMNIPANAFNM